MKVTRSKDKVVRAKRVHVGLGQQFSGLKCSLPNALELKICACKRECGTRYIEHGTNAKHTESVAQICCLRQAMSAALIYFVEACLADLFFRMFMLVDTHITFQYRGCSYFTLGKCLSLFELLLTPFSFLPYERKDTFRTQFTQARNTRKQVLTGFKLLSFLCLNAALVSH